MKKLSKDDSDKVESMLNELIRIRQGKIVRLADSSKLTSDLLSKLSVEEEVYYNQIHKASLDFKKQIIGDLGELNSEVLKCFDLEGSLVTVFRIDIDQLYSLVGVRERKYEQFSKYPESSRDLALIVDKNLSFYEIESVFKKHKYVKDVFPFDIYTDDSLGDNKKSVAFQVTFQSTKNTLTAEQIDRCMEDLLNKLQRSIKVEMR